MPRTARIAPAGVVFHVINRGVGRRVIFEKEEDYAAFERVMARALAAVPVQLGELNGTGAINWTANIESDRLNPCRAPLESHRPE